MPPPPAPSSRTTTSSPWASTLRTLGCEDVPELPRARTFVRTFVRAFSGPASQYVLSAPEAARYRELTSLLPAKHACPLATHLYPPSGDLSADDLQQSRSAALKRRLALLSARRDTLHRILAKYRDGEIDGEEGDEDEDDDEEDDDDDEEDEEEGMDMYTDRILSLKESLANLLRALPPSAAALGEDDDNGSLQQLRQLVQAVPEMPPTPDIDRGVDADPDADADTDPDADIDTIAAMRAAAFEQLVLSKRCAAPPGDNGGAALSLRLLRERADEQIAEARSRVESSTRATLTAAMRTLSLMRLSTVQHCAAADLRATLTYLSSLRVALFIVFVAQHARTAAARALLDALPSTPSTTPSPEHAPHGTENGQRNEIGNRNESMLEEELWLEMDRRQCEAFRAAWDSRKQLLQAFCDVENDQDAVSAPSRIASLGPGAEHEAISAQLRAAIDKNATVLSKVVTAYTNISSAIPQQQQRRGPVSPASSAS